MAVGIVENGRITYLKGFGYQDISRRESVSDTFNKYSKNGWELMDMERYIND